MSILRKEIPKPLDYETIIENLYATKLNPNEIKSTIDSEFGQQGFGSATPMAPILCSTHTNDGTTCVFYPSGRIAILSVNVFGYYYENVVSNYNLNSNQAQTNVNMSSVGLSTSNTSVNNHQAHTANTSLSSVSNSNRLLNWMNLKDSYTTIVFDDKKLTSESASFSNSSSRKFKNMHADGSILAVISPNGSCVCYRKNGTARFICTELGGCFCDEKGGLSHQWKWNSIKEKDLDYIKKNLKKELNEFIRIEYESPFSIILKFECHKEIIEFNLGCNKDHLNRLHEFLHKLSSDIPLQSRTPQTKNAKNVKLVPIQASKQHQHHQHQHQQQHNAPGSLFKKTGQKENHENKILDKLYDNTICYRDIPVLKDLLVIQRRIRAILDEWLMYCRTILSISEPTVYMVPDIPDSRNFNENNINFSKITVFKRKSKSADYDRSHLKKKQTMRSHTRGHISNRALFLQMKRARSTLSGRYRSLSSSLRKYLTMSLVDFKKEFLAPVPPKRSSPKLKRISTAYDRNKRALISTPEEPRLSRIDESGLDDENQRSRSRSNLRDEPLVNHDMCPIAFRIKILLDRRTECKCKKNIVPIISDIELDKFLRITPPEQLQLVSIIDSSITTPNGMEDLIQQLYESYNRNKFKPCIMSSKDDMRIYYYDTKSVTGDPNEPLPLLVQRHNVIPGMILIYQNSKLVFCDHIFNGYGNSLSDFMKQLNQTKLDAKAGKYLPNNFRFQHPKGDHGNRTAWGGEIGGLVLQTEGHQSRKQSEVLNSLSPIKTLQTLKSKEPQGIFQKNQHVILPKILKVNSLHY